MSVILKPALTQSDRPSSKGGLAVLKIYVAENVLKAYGRVHSPQTYPRTEYPFRKVIDRFVIKGTEGKHICIVHEAPSLDSGQMGSDAKMDLESMRVSIRQLLILLDYLHTDCNLTARIYPHKHTPWTYQALTIE